jgi:polyvinyl alcohol dehydrogenase (cytochrome)
MFSATSSLVAVICKIDELDSSALDASTGAVVWKTYSIAEEPKPRGKTKDGVQTWGPAGGGIWAAPTIDPRRSAIYIATGNGYSDPPQRTTDELIVRENRLQGVGQFRAHRAGHTAR